MLCLIAFVITVILSIILIPLFNDLAGKTISTGFFQHFSNILLLLFTSICIGFIAGIYPALVLSSYKPIVVLKGRFVTGTRGILLRKGLVITQFTISIALIIATIVVYNQLKYMRNQDLGFNKDQMLIIDTNGDKNKDAFKQSISSVPGVLALLFPVQFREVAIQLHIPKYRIKRAICKPQVLIYILWILIFSINIK